VNDNFISEFYTDINCDDFIEFHENIAIKSPRSQGTVKDEQSFLHELIGADEVLGIESLTSYTNFILSKWVNVNNDCLTEYMNQYSLSNTRLENISCKIQKTAPCQGFHSWHHDRDPIDPNRKFVTILYLNDNFEGGETEFLYHSTRIKPEKGKLVIFPAGWTHTHRGNPPLDGDKYIATGWIEEFKTTQEYEIG
tara:strand:+ start:266 stop:850 length:585 start_codon:yes stop_codon:yes gene_type:complete